MVSGARVTGQILKIINREGEIFWGEKPEPWNNVCVLCKQLNQIMLFCGSNVSRTASMFLVFADAYPVFHGGWECQDLDKPVG